MKAMVVQFGLAMMPLARRAMACGFTSETTRGTSGSMRHAEELSMTTAPAAANFGARAREPAAPAENRAMSSPAGRPSSASSTTISAPLPRQRAAGGPGRGEVAELVHGERPLLEDAAHHAADLAGCTDNTHAHGRQRYRPPARPARRMPRTISATAVRCDPATAAARRSRGRRVRAPNAVCSDCTASCRAGAGTTTVVRIVEVEIISMLMPVSQRAEHLGGDAGTGLHAGADEARPWRCRRRG